MLSDWVCAGQQALALPHPMLTEQCRMAGAVAAAAPGLQPSQRALLGDGLPNAAVLLQPEGDRQIKLSFWYIRCWRKSIDATGSVRR